ncbi:MAG: hypothetical protein GXP56_03515 [Deltaproteobacteria bacterium]|nr:hypothetical protein [Deltaproteobacteria bacterium]
MFRGSDITQDLKFYVTNAMADTCNECGVCKKECGFLMTYGNPGSIAENYKADPGRWLGISFECSLCGLCTSVCPKELDPAAWFLDLRKEAVKKGLINFSKHKTLLNYEKKGNSKKYSLYSLPENCDTVFFPGCTLAGTRPANTLNTFEYLKKQVENTGIVLDCCTKVSHDLGRQDYFNEMFFEMKSFLIKHKIKTIIVACPNCHKIFNTYGKEFKVETVYDIISRFGFDDTRKISGQITIHDPCPMRFEKSIQDSVRSVLRKKGLEIVDTPHQKSKTFCCGEGGSVACVSPGFAQTWKRKRVNEASPHKIVSYCAGCVNLLSKSSDAFHVLDLVFDPEKTMAGKAKISKPPFTYLNRLKLKRKLKRKPAKTTRERTYTAFEKKRRNGVVLKLIFAGLIIAAIAWTRAAGALAYLDPGKLSGLIHESGNLGSVIYMLVYALAPALFLPGLPITIAGGILFGPVWGIVYSITGATTGAGIAFLISRYISSDFIESKLTGPKWIKLQDNVKKHGWKAVALTRLIPLFPFNLLNYAFGLTKIKFSHYIIATFICMLPACIAFIVFSSSLLDLVQGKLSKEFIIGLVLIVMVSLIPVIYNKIMKKGKNGI